MAEVKDKVVTVESLATLHDYNENAYMSVADPTGSGSLSMNRKPDTTIGDYSATLGQNNEASGWATHAEGMGTTSSGSYAHSEGFGTVAYGMISHAEGSETTAGGTASHSEGMGTIANGHSQHVQGRYNIQDDNNEYAHIVGNGDSSTTPSNAHTIDWDGNAWFAGNLSTDGNIILTSNQYGDTLPAAGTVGRVFFKKISE